MNRKKSSLTVTGALIFFALIASVIQIAILTYDYIIKRTTNKLIIAVLILIIVISLSVICVVIDAIRRRVSIDRPVSQILDATEKIAQGDFSVRLTPSHPYEKYNELDFIMENINSMAEELNKSSVLKIDFISNMSHELKTPLAIIKNYATLIQDESLDSEERRKCAAAMHQASERLSILINSILKLNKLESHNAIPDISKFNLTSALSSAIVEHEELIEKKKLTLECELDDVVAVSSLSCLEIVWNNLLSNAIKFTDEGGAITVTLKKRDRDVIIKVSDTGCGISPKSGKRIFDKFYQEDTSHRQEGNGLGLSLVKRVIDILGGEISVESELGKGSCFTVILKGIVTE
ncbi:MAG: HAMP domain-containing histidine kinase [Clostridia bacterium]|nr:HAMP domain-containing histidine kinase [Clostridia bacterium]